MRTFLQKQNQRQQTSAARLPRSKAGTAAARHEAHRDLVLPLAVGNQAVQRMLQAKADGLETVAPEVDPTNEAAFTIQSQLPVNTLGDTYEEEADRVAEEVMRTPEPQLPHRFTDQAGQRLQTKHVDADHSERTTAPPSVNDVVGSAGQPLDESERAFFEPRFGHDFSRVRVHSGVRAEQSARDVNAKAYTVGTNIVFGAGSFAPGTSEGRRLIAHELTHVLQQRSASSAMGLQRLEDDPRALDVVREDTPRRVRVSEWLVEKVNGGGTSRAELYWAEFEVDATGVLRASVRTVSPDRTYRSRTLRFGNEFRRAVQHFADSNVAVTSFEADWSWMSKEEISENLKVFREGLAKGWTRERAAQDTPTGKVLGSSGFEVTHVENVPESQEHLVEEGVRRWRVKAIFRRTPSAPVAPPAAPVTGETPGKGVPSTPTQEFRGSDPVSVREIGMEAPRGGGRGGGAAGGRSVGSGRGGGGRGAGGRGGRGGGFGLGAVWVEAMYPEIAKQAKAQAKADEIARKLSRYDKEINDRVNTMKADIAKSQLNKEAHEKVYANVVYEVHHFEFSVDVYLKSVEVTTRNLNSQRRYSTVRQEQGWAGTGNVYNVRRDVDEHTYSVEVWVYSEAELERFAELSDEYLKTKRKLALLPYDESLARHFAEVRKEIVDTFGSDVWFLNLETYE